MAPFLLQNDFSVVQFIENYGWYVLICGIILLCIYQKFVKEIWINYKKQRDEAAYAAKHHKNPDLLESRLSAQLSHVEKLQEKYNKDALEHKKKLEERQERKRQELLDKFPDSGRKLGTSDDKNKKSSLKPDYNPLMGNSGGSSYRPPKRSACGGGGCG